MAPLPEPSELVRFGSLAMAIPIQVMLAGVFVWVWWYRHSSRLFFCFLPFLAALAGFKTLHAAVPRSLPLLAAQSCSVCSRARLLLARACCFSSPCCAYTASQPKPSVAKQILARSAVYRHSYRAQRRHGRRWGSSCCLPFGNGCCIPPSCCDLVL
ncbi:hypothetical protein IWZ03DRAFT_190405 [Phyllosticta citriasiana]|uniref:Uncharacterized protein n=1 Tax=Phyllosticta citriasiana TaxID=595635 RepID=A0ABR1KKP9_9PEZI